MRRNIGRLLTAASFGAALAGISAQAAAPAKATGTIKASIYQSGTGGLAFTNDVKFPNSPDGVWYPKRFEWYSVSDTEKPTNHPSDFSDIPAEGGVNDGSKGNLENFGTLVAGYLYPPTTGDYQFAISADDPAALFLSTDDNPANKVRIADEPTWNDKRAFAAEDRRTRVDVGTAEERLQNQSKFIRLEAGKAYYIEAIAKEGGGGDNLAVGWRKRGDAEFTNDDPPISGQYLAPIDGKDASSPYVNVLSGAADGFSITVRDGDGGTSLATAGLSVQLNGAPVTVTTARSASGTATVVTYKKTDGFLPSGSSHTVKLVGKDSKGANLTVDTSFTVPRYGFLPASVRVTNVDTSKPGFIWRVHHNPANQDNNNTKTERALSGELGLPNLADPSAQGAAIAPGKVLNDAAKLVEFEVADVINFDQTGGSNGAFTPDNQMPGIPGLEGSTDGIAAEIITYIELPKGLTRMIVNSDDGFYTTAGVVKDKLQATFLGEFNGGRGASDTEFPIIAEEAGFYEFRTTWQEGGGGANIEWVVLKANGEKVLVNDTANGGPRAFRALVGGSSTPYARKASPASGATDVPPNSDIVIELVDTASTKVDTASVTLKLDGAAITPTVAKSGDVTTISWVNTGLFAPLSVHNVELGYKAGATPVSRAYSFTVSNYRTISTANGTKPGSGKDAGFRLRTVQSEAGRGNTDVEAEAQLKDNSGNPNVADLSGAGANGFFTHTGVINFNQDAPGAVGNFSAGNGFEDALPPGIPGTGGSTDNFSQEVLTFLELPAGAITMGVNSDDGFKVTPATGVDASAPVLGIFDGGRGASDSIFTFVVPTAGVYPMRLIWYEGGGGANAEWFTVDKAGNKILINSSTPGAIKAYRTRDESQTLPSGGGTATIAVARDGANLTITFTGKLQAADSVNGPYTDVAGATSPRTVTPTGAAKFYRAAQ